MSQVFEEREIKVQVSPRRGEIEADVDRMIQVMLNLLADAAKFCDAGTRAHRDRAVGAAGCFQIDVRDNGPASRRAGQKVIFDKFRQVGDTLTAKPLRQRPGPAHQPPDRRAFRRPPVGGEQPRRQGAFPSRCLRHGKSRESSSPTTSRTSSRRSNTCCASGFDVRVARNGERRSPLVERRPRPRSARRNDAGAERLRGSRGSASGPTGPSRS